MPLGTTYIPDTASYHTGGVTQSLSAAQMNTLYGSSNVKTATSSFTFSRNGHYINFSKGRPVFCDADLLTQLSALSAPVA